ncbi:ATPase, T2SS/T4P/T4SS family [Acidiphilium acidophilum]|uniref:ATPase, T2SS/T4P/T4SS family n=1 Tax=Acidiphilium acidophilum TaxID=76588 RepID=UPI002E8E718B|nr:ATPase, T2SS/T4P/T4SS family [Acidiphilium acidophilum]
MNEIITIVPDQEPPRRSGLLWPGETIRTTGSEFDDLLAWATAQGASDIRLQNNQPVWIRIHGREMPVTSRTLIDAEVEEAINRLYGADGQARLRAGEDFDVSYEFRPSRRHLLRFRVNATAVRARGNDGGSVTLRTLPAVPPRLADLDVEPDILANFKIRQGFVIVSGGVENGKSTLLAAMTRAILEDPESNRWIIELAAPIEFVYDSIVSVSSGISQSEIPRHLPSFAAGARNAMRRNPKMVIVGECRDSETMVPACHLSIAGCGVYTTLHAGCMVETIQRAVSFCPVNEREAVAVQLAQSLRLVVNQRLVPSADGKRTALREYLVFDDALRRRLLSAAPSVWPEIAHDALARLGQSFRVAAQRALARGKITEETAYLIGREFGDVG